jgi:hypothetical protein
VSRIADAQEKFTGADFMAFQPFGYRFEIKSPSQPADVKSAIRLRTKKWFDPKNGARGWIAGPFICLWFSALDRYGPMLLGRIVEDGFGTRIKGRAGSDLNGIALYSLWIPTMVLLVYQMVSAGDYTLGQLAIFGGLILLSPLVLWASHKDRRQAEPLVRFLRDAVTVSGRTLRKKSTSVPVSEAINLVVGGENRAGPITSDTIHDALLGLGEGDFVVLEKDPETYLQTASRDGSYIIEMREGDDQRHFQAVRRGAAPTAPERTFSFEEVLEACLAYSSDMTMPHYLTWEQLHLKG